MADNSSRIDWLDGWRAVAVSLVILAHLAGPYPWLWAAPGKLGVFIFFAISGFIVTRLLVRERAKAGNIQLGRFYVRRAVRILPPLLVYVAVCLLLQQAPFSAAVRSVLFTCNITHLPGDCGWVFGHTWSLAFEEQYYLLIPVLLASRHRWILLGAVPLALLPFAFPLNWIGRIGFLQIYMLLGLGAGYALAEQKLAPLLTRVPPFAALAMLVAAGYWVGLTPGRLQMATGLLVPGGIVIAVFSLPQASKLAHRILASKPISKLGVWSYTLYLWQQLALTVAPWNTGLLPLVKLAGALAIAALSFRFLEEPLRNLVRRAQA